MAWVYGEKKTGAKPGGKGELRLISPEPVLAKILRARKPILIGQEGYEWIVDWIEDIGKIMRSRENIAYNIASMADYAILQGFIKLLAALGFAEFAKLLGRR